MSLSTSSGVRCSRLRRSRFGTRAGGRTFPFSVFGWVLRVGRNCTTVAMAPTATFPFTVLLGKDTRRAESGQGSFKGCREHGLESRTGFDTLCDGCSPRHSSQACRRKGPAAPLASAKLCAVRKVYLVAGGQIAPA